MCTKNSPDDNLYGPMGYQLVIYQVGFHTLEFIAEQDLVFIHLVVV